MQQDSVATPQSLAHYAANPDALANMTDDQLDALANTPSGQTSADPVTTTGDSNGSVAPGTATDQSNQGAGAAATPTATPVASTGDAVKGVQAKDGTHIIPFSVLEREREGRLRAEQMLQAQSDEIERLKAGGTATETNTPAPQMSAEDLDQLDLDMPGVAKAIRAQQALIEHLSGTVKTLQSHQQVDQEVKQQSVKDEVEAAIASNPDISAWREAASRAENPDPLMWNRAADLDRVLRNDPEWQDKPVAARFAKVAETMRAMYGTTPAISQSSTALQGNSAALQAKAEAALASATKAGSSIPFSSSDIPGGTAPAVDEASALMAKTGPELTAAFMEMTPEQIEAKLNRLR